MYPFQRQGSLLQNRSSVHHENRYGFKRKSSKEKGNYNGLHFGILVWTVFSGEEPYPGIPATIIQRCVSEGQRPRATVLDQYSDVKMVPEAKALMIRCWDHNADNRPSFHECSESTTVMYEAYQKETVYAVRSVQDCLLNMDSSDKECESMEFISGNTDEFIKALQNGGTSQDSQQISLKPTGEDLKPPMAFETVGETIKEEEDDSNIGDNFATALTKTGGYKKIMGNLTNEGLISEDVLNSSQNLRDIGNITEKLFLGCKKNPALIVPTIRSFF